MARSRTIGGKSTQGNHPEWKPLVDTVGEDLASDFMWMFEVELEDGRRIQAYKHIDSRCYLHLAADGAAFVYEHPDRYRPMPAAELLAAVIRPLIGLASVSPDQISRSWAAVARLSDPAI